MDFTLEPVIAAFGTGVQSETMINKRFAESYYIYIHINIREAAHSPIHFLPYAVYCIQVRQINPGGGTGAGQRTGDSVGAMDTVYRDGGVCLVGGVTAGQYVSVPGGWHEPEWEERKPQGAHDTEDSLRSTTNTCRDRDRQGLHHKGNSGLRIRDIRTCCGGSASRPRCSRWKP